MLFYHLSPVFKNNFHTIIFPFLRKKLYLAFDRFFIPRLTENFKFKCKSNVKIIVGLLGELKKKTTTFCLRLEKQTTCDKCEHIQELNWEN